MSDESWEQKVRERAHAIWEREGRSGGAAERHWAMAELELRAEGVERLAAPTTQLLGAHSAKTSDQPSTGKKRPVAP
jgi:hypothetical protein